MEQIEGLTAEIDAAASYIAQLSTEIGGKGTPGGGRTGGRLGVTESPTLVLENTPVMRNLLKSAGAGEGRFAEVRSSRA